MQTRFAVITLHNAEAQQRVKVLAATLNGRWVAYRLDRAVAVSWRDSAQREPRTASFLTPGGGLGTVNNAEKAFTEIAMLLKRHAMLMARNYYYDDPIDWRVEEIAPCSFKELFDQIATGLATHGLYMESMKLALRMLLSPRRLVSATAVSQRQQRALALATNISARLQTIANRKRGFPASMESYMGVLASVPGATWRGQRYVNTSTSDREVFLHKRTLMRSFGTMLGQCIWHSRMGKNFEGLYNELLASLRPGSGDEYSDLYQVIPAHSRARIADAMNLIHNNTIMYGDCGHFFENGTGGFINQRGRGAQLHWCTACVQTRSVRVADLSSPRLEIRWPREQTHRSGNGQYYSYAYDDATAAEANHAIMSYSTNVTRLLPTDPNIESSHYGDFLMGFELEMTSGREFDPTTAARDVRRSLGTDYCIVKSDGSLPSNGFEVVTAPRGIAEHVRRVTAWQINPAYRAWDTGSCGLHVHISSRAFTEMTLGKFIMLYNAHENATFIRKLAGRHPFKDSQAARYCAQEEQEVLANPKAAVKGKGAERYRMINTTNLSRAEAERLGLPNHGSGRYDTVEVRIYKASLRKERLLAQLEFTHAAVMFCRVASYRELNGKTFQQWLVPHSKAYPNLANWFGVRKSKALKDAGDKPLQEVCVDRVQDPEAAPPPLPPIVPLRRADVVYR